MNRRCYRIVFNEKRGTMMVVAEKHGIGKGAARNAPVPIQKDVDVPAPSMRLSVIALAILTITGALFLLPSTANAQIVADPTAPGNQQPTIINTANGLPQVNIQTPSAGGVSRNTYSQFDVQQQGAILNNSRTDVQTQLGGWIQGNSNLANGGARVILNEINSSNPSYLRGYVEVAGGRAQVIIANPSGVTCDGCGFINANRATLTTGEAIVTNGNLDGYRVSRGMVTVQGEGLNARDTDYTDIIARAAQINAGIWGKTLKVTAGTNQVDAANNIVQAMPIATQDTAPSFGIDVAQLGGMYAHKIILIGTEAGVGVRNAGEIGAAAGDVIVRSDGQLINSNSIQATGDIHLAATNSIDNSAGTISAGRSLQISDQAVVKVLQIKNTDGSLFAGDQLDIAATGLTGDGNILSDGDLKLKLVDGFINTGVVQADGLLDMETGDVLVNRGQLRAGDIADLHAMNIDNRSDGTITAKQLNLNAADTLGNRGSIDAEDTFIDARNVDNFGTGRIYGDHIAIRAEALRNEAESIDGITTAATIAARDRLDIAADTIANREHATLFSLGDMAIGGDLNADHRAIGQAGTLDNNSATIEATGALDLATKLINNTNEHFDTEEVEVSRQQITEYQLAGSPNRYRPDEININNDEVDHLVTPEGFDTEFHRYDYMRLVRETKIKETDPAKILSGRTMRITADAVLNDKSVVMAGGSLTGDIGALSNIEVKGQRVMTDSGTATYYYRIYKRGRDHQGVAVSDYSPAAFIQAFDLAPTIYEQNAKGSGSGIEIASRDTESMDTAILLPDNSMFAINANPGFNYLVQSDPNFTDHRIWLSSDYLLQQMGADPVSVQKRLGDGFYEQKLIREQIGELTGRRFLDGYADDEAQYRALLDNGATYAKKLNLRVGVALSAEQMSELTSDVVLLIEKDVTLPNGEINKVLVPQLYAKVREGDINGAGALLSGDAVDLEIQGDVVNSGTITGRTHLALDADNVKNLGGRISAADVLLQAVNDIDNLGGAIDAVDKLDVAAGRDLNIVSTTHTAHSAQGSRTNIDGVASLSVANSGATLIATAGRDVNMKAGQVINSGTGGNTSIAAGRDLNLGTVTESNAQSISWSANNHREETANQDVGSVIQTQGNLNLSTGNDFTAKAATVNSEQGTLDIKAAGDIKLTAGNSGQSLDESHQSSGSSGWFSKKTTKSHDKFNQNVSKGSSLAGNTIGISAGRDIAMAGSSVISIAGATLVAGRDITAIAATNTHSESHAYEEKTSGIMGAGGLGFSIGSQSQGSFYDGDEATQSLSGSVIGASEGHVRITSGGDVVIKGSDVIAGHAEDGTGGDIAITAKNIVVGTSDDQSHSEQRSMSRNNGMTIALVGTPLDSLRNLRSITNGNGSKAQKTKSVMEEISASGLTMAQLAVSVGNRSASTKSTIDNLSNNASNLIAGGNIHLTATGSDQVSNTSKEPDGNIEIVGSNLTAGEAAVLNAKGDVSIIASTDRVRWDKESVERGASMTTAITSLGDLGRNVSGGPNNSGVGLAPHRNSRGNESSTSVVEQQSASTISAGSVDINSANGNISVTGSGIAAEQDVKLSARQGLIDITSGRNTQTQHSEQSSKVIGDLGSSNGGTAASIGIRTSDDTFDSSEQLQNAVRSLIISNSGNVTLDAKRDVNVKGSDLSASKDLTLIGENVNLDAGTDWRQSAETHNSSQIGITAAFGGMAGQLAQAANQSLEGQASGDDKLAKLYAAKAAITAANATKGIAGPNGERPTLIKATVSLGSSDSESQFASHTSEQQGSVLAAGQTVTIIATGSDTNKIGDRADDGDINAVGSQISGKDVHMAAARDINLISAIDLEEHHGTNSSGGVSIGVGAALGGEQNGFTLEVGANGSKGAVNGDSLVNHNTHITAGDSLSIISGRDTNLDGAQLRADSVKVEVGRDLNIHSRQDIDNVQNEQDDVGAGVSLCIPPFCYGNMVAANGSIESANVDSSYASVQEQSGIYTGDGGYDIQVTRNTDLQGGAIAGSRDEEKNALVTGTLTTGDIENKAIYISKSGNTSASLDNDEGYAKQALNGVTKELENNSNGSLKGDVGGVTKSAISDGHIAITDKKSQLQKTGETAEETVANLNRDVENANQSIDKIFDLEEVQRQQEISKLTNEIAQGIAPILYEKVGDFLQDSKANTPEKIAVHALIGGLISKAKGGEFGSGAAGAAAAKLAVEVFAGDIDKIEGLSKQDKDALTEMLGLVVAKTATQAAGGTQTEGNAAGVNAKIATEFNFLKHKQFDSFKERYAQCDSEQCKGQVLVDMKNLSEAQNSLLSQCMTTESCKELTSNIVYPTEQDGFLGFFITEVKDVYNFCPAGDGACASTLREISEHSNKALFTHSIPEFFAKLNWQDATLADAVAELQDKFGLSHDAAAMLAGTIVQSMDVKGEAGGAAKASIPIGRGSTGRVIPNNFKEKFALEEAHFNTELGHLINVRGGGLNDPRWPASKGWVKMAKNINGVEIHYVRNTINGAVDDFKFFDKKVKK